MRTSITPLFRLQTLLGTFLLLSSCSDSDTSSTPDGTAVDVPSPDAPAESSGPEKHDGSAGTGGAGGAGADAGAGGAGGHDNDAVSPDGPDDGPPDGDDTGDAIDAEGDRPEVDEPEAPGPDLGPPLADLALWLRADSGVECAPYNGINRVVRWQDRSAHKRDAQVDPGGRGPLCGPNANTINGHGVLTFPRSADAKAEEHLNVDLGVLADRSFTIAVVERRKDPAVITDSHNQFSWWLLGAKLPDVTNAACVDTTGSTQLSFPNQGRALRVGYPMPIFLNATTWGKDCDFTAFVPERGNKPDVMVLTYTAQHGFVLHYNGVVTDAFPPGTSPVKGLSEWKAMIGRGQQVTEPFADTRYFGDMAEIVIYGAALQEPERKALEGYLDAYWDSNL